MEPVNALATREDLSVTTGLTEDGFWRPRNLDDMRQVCVWIAQSKIAPAGFDTPEKIFIGLQTAMECGLKPLSGLRMLYVVHNTPSWRGTGALALIRSRGNCKLPPILRYEGEGDDLRAIWRSQRHDMPQAIDVEFSVADAKQAGLWGKVGPWKSDPKGMLAWRACSRMADRYFSDILAGLSIMEVVRDYPAEEFSRVEAGAKPVAAASGMLNAGEDPLLSDGTTTPVPTPTAASSPVAAGPGPGEEGGPAAAREPDAILEPEQSPEPTQEPGGPSAVEAAAGAEGPLGDQNVSTAGDLQGEAVGSEEAPPVGDLPGTQEPPETAAGAAYCTEGEPTITKRKASHLRGQAANRCFEIGWDSADARFTLCEEALGCPADDVTDDRYEAAKLAIKAFEMP